MNHKANKPSDEFELQPSLETPKPRDAGPVAPKAAPAELDPNDFDPPWAKQAPAAPATGTPRRRTTGAQVIGTPRRRTTGAQTISEPELQPSEALPDLPPDRLPLDGPPPSNKVDFENLPEFVAQRKMLKNIKIGAAIAGAVIVLIVVFIVFRASKSTIVPITDELRKDTPDIGDHFKDKKE